MARRTPGSAVVERVFAVIRSRRRGNARTSHTARLFAKGRAAIACKLGEEAVETVAAALAEPKSRVVEESADLLFHLLVLWAEMGIRPAQVWKELARREGRSGIAEKASRRVPKPSMTKGGRRGLRSQ